MVKVVKPIARTQERDLAMKTILALLLLAAPLSAAELKTTRDLPYAEPKTERNTLDVYAPAAGQGHPIIVYIHGGGWTRGSKDGVGKKPQVFADRGFVFVSINYRFVPNVNVNEMTGDVAKAIRYVRDQAKEYGGDPESIFVMGHSAGAHLAALVCTDERYLKDAGLSLAAVKGCVPVDVSAYDIPARLKVTEPPAPAAFKTVFGDTEETQRDYSPALHVAAGKNIPPFLILHVADRPETKVQSHAFAEKLKAAGVQARVVAAEGTNHGTINSNIGLPDDKPTRELFEFLAGTLKK
jgi:arylformamidase